MTCEYCNGKQLIPFVKDGRVIPFAWVNCICKVEEPDHFREIRPEDFDFPCSSFFRESTFELYGRPWERRHEIYQPEEQPMVQEPPQPWDKRQQYQIDQVRSELMNIKHTMAERTKPKQLQPQKSTYKGLVMKDNDIDKK